MSIPGWEVPPNMVPVSAPAGESCGICREAFNEPHQTECGHVFCRRCALDWYNQIIDNAINAEDPNNTEYATIDCPVCRSTLYTAGLISTHNRVHFMMVPVLIRRSGLLDGSFSIGVGTFRAGSTFPVREVGEAVDFLLRGGWRLEDNPCRLVPALSARDAIIMGNILQALALHNSARLRQSDFGRHWTYIVESLARLLLQQWPSTLTISGELQQWLRNELSDECAVNDPTNPIRPDEHASWFRRLTTSVGPVTVHDGFVEALIDYVVHLASQRHLEAWIGDYAREARHRSLP